jgi:hypothetical protein
MIENDVKKYNEIKSKIDEYLKLEIILKNSNAIPIFKKTHCMLIGNICCNQLGLKIYNKTYKDYWGEGKDLIEERIKISCKKGFFKDVDRVKKGTLVRCDCCKKKFGHFEIGG